MSVANCTIVVVESDPGLSSAYARLAAVAAEGRTVVPVSEVKSAWSLIQRGIVGILVLATPAGGDAQPLELLRRIRFQNRPVDVIVVSSDSTTDAVRGMQRLGVADYLISPIIPERFLHSLRHLVYSEQTGRGSLSQSEIDRLRTQNTASHSWMPREISADRLASVRAYIAVAADPLSAAAVGQALGFSRVTARRYLEFLVTLGELDFESVAERPGRPLKVYEPRVLSAAS